MGLFNLIILFDFLLGRKLIKFLFNLNAFFLLLRLVIYLFNLNNFYQLFLGKIVYFNLHFHNFYLLEGNEILDLLN